MSVPLLRRLVGSDDVTNVVLIRHGETESNRASLVEGPDDEGLTQRGRSQAEALRTYLHRALPSAFDPTEFRWFASPAKRSIETIESIGTGLPYEIESAFAEVSVGQVRGHSWEGAVRHGVISADHEVGSMFPLGESYASAQERALKAFHAHMRERRPSDIAIVAHGGIISLLVLGLLEAPLELFPFSEIANGSCTIVVRHTFENRTVSKLKLLNFVPGA